LPPRRSPSNRTSDADAERATARSVSGSGPERTVAPSIRKRSISAAERNGRSVAEGPSDAGLGAPRSRRTPSSVTKRSRILPLEGLADEELGLRRFDGEEGPLSRKADDEAAEAEPPPSVSSELSRAEIARPDATPALRRAASTIRCPTGGAFSRAIVAATRATRSATTPTRTRRARDRLFFSPRATGHSRRVA
jgi:hypothetical protein